MYGTYEALIDTKVDVLDLSSPLQSDYELHKAFPRVRLFATL